ncbi:zinc ribbon-containing protein [Vibrio sp. TH_r3]|uniref:zinc ribbon-containing protein n=1 Tax=Vibrio sp. TH_r3 TaxID=3082084 RepID=UPI0029549D10|nr:zinc ribbon-containing protein [Vibrio sp. TH_r3]MDV7104794.1 zinc ribbon-containing protein [Vibrio sp. TH_r3]
MSKRKLGYEETFEAVVETLKHSPEELSKVLESSEEVAKAASDMTKDEIALVSAYVKSDLKEFAESYQESKDSPFSIMVADSMWQALLDITDRTKVEWVELFADLEHHGVYNTGEIIGLGHLVCEKCGDKTQYIHPTVIEPCRKCGGNQFTRLALKP